MDSSLTAYTALLIWPLVATLLYALRTPFQATLWTLLGAHLMLPVGTMIKIEMLPQVDKATVPTFCALIGCLICRTRTRYTSGQETLLGRVAGGLVLAYIIGAFISPLLNSDPVIFGERVIPGTGLYDGISAAEAAIITLVPFYLGWKFFGAASDAAEMIRSLVIAGLLYSILMLIEIRFSPQLHFWLYGFYPSDFQQQVRGSGYRPMVFTGHGLIAAIFLMTTVAASAAMAKAKDSLWGGRVGKFNAYLGAVLVLCKSLGAIVFGGVATALIWLASPRVQVRAAVLLVTLSLGYPLLRTFDLIPTRVITDMAGDLNKERALSIATRFLNEDRLLSRASERELFGWGRYGRSRVYDPESGRDITIADGRWIQTLGQFGLFGFLSEFGLLTLAVFRACRAIRYCRDRRELIYLAALSLIVSLNVLDLLPNPTLRPWTWFLCGVVFARGEDCVASARRVRIGHLTKPTNALQAG